MENNSLINKNNVYIRFLDKLEKKIESTKFKNALEEVQKIDLKHFSKVVQIEDLKKWISDLKNKASKQTEFKLIQIVTPGNPEVVFKVCLESILQETKLILVIEDFCLAQNTFIVSEINELINEFRFGKKIELKNLLSDSEIIRTSKTVRKTIIVGDSNLYNRLLERVDNIYLNPYGIFSMYSDSEEYEELQELIYGIMEQNQFEIESYDDLKLDDAIKLINKNGYGFCTIIFSSDKKVIEEAKNKIVSNYIIINKNPFKEIEFEIEI